MDKRFRLHGRFRPGPAKCCRCGKPAVWHYSPSFDGKHDWCWVYCDRCVPRGCSCVTDRDSGLPYRDKRGRMLPCCEFSYDPPGYSLWLDTRGRAYRPDQRKTGRFIARWPRYGSLIRWPPAWYVSSFRTWGSR
jgi:hypothetical protein